MYTEPRFSQDALDESLRQLELLASEAEDRRRATDAKIGALQGTGTLILTIVAGFVGLISIKPGTVTIGTMLQYAALAPSIGFFVWAMQKIRAASDPQFFQSRTVSGIVKTLRATNSKHTLELEAIADYKSIIEANNRKIDAKLTLYRAAIENIIKGIYCIAAIPLIVLVGMIWTLAGGTGHNNSAAPQTQRCVAPHRSSKHPKIVRQIKGISHAR